MSSESSAREPLATWNPARCVWETTQQTLCGHSEPYVQTWPRSGSTVAGRLYELPTLERATGAPESSSSLSLPTPVADHSRGLAQPGTDYSSLPNAILSL